MTSKIVATITLLLALASCQSAPGEPTDYSAIKDPGVRSTLLEQDRQMTSGRAAYTAFCKAKWSQDSSLVELCMRAQEQAMNGFVINRVTWENLAKQGDVAPARAGKYRNCQMTYPSDFEMAAACVQNQEAVDRLALDM